MLTNEIKNRIEQLTSDYRIEDADEGDIGYYAYVDGGYLPECYQSEESVLLAILEELWK